MYCLCTVLCNVICWSLIHIPGVTPLMKTHPQKPIAPQVAVGAHTLCYSIDCFYLEQVLFRHLKMM